MKTVDFIEKVARGEREKSGSCGSVYFDGTHLFSYGSHYPLLMNIGGKWILNREGYSATTAKHISWARSFADYVIEIPNHKGTNPLLRELLPIINDNINAQIDIIETSRKGAFRKIEEATRKLEEFTKTKYYLISLK